MNNPGAELTASWYISLKAKYIIVGDECGEKGTKHHQGYVYWANGKTFSAVKKLLPKGAHIEKARGSPEQNQEYCGKECILVENGELPKQGARSDIVAVKEIIKAGGDMRKVIEETNSYQAWRAAEMYLKYNEPKRDWAPVVKWYWGPTGTGKTRTAVEEFPDAWISGNTLQWWDGYDGQASVIIDDFRGDFCPFHVLLRVLDRYAFRVPTKGGFRQLLAKNIVITCPYKPSDVYKTVEDKAQLLRRLTEVRAFGEICTAAAQKSGGNTTPPTGQAMTFDEIKELVDGVSLGAITGETLV